MPAVIIDTDVAIDYLRGKEYTRNLILPLWDNNQAYLSILSVYELYAGIKKNEREFTENFIGACRIEPVSLEIAKSAGELFKHYREKGITLTAVDCLISATAVVKQYKILTRNTGHYPNKDLLWLKV